MRQTEILVAAIVFALAHLVSPALVGKFRDPRSFESFSGGLAVAYVFLYLIPELDEGHQFVGERIYVLSLVAFAVMYALEYRLHRRTGQEAATGRYRLILAVGAVYSCLLVFTLGAKLPERLALTTLFTISIGMHLLFGSMGASRRFGERFKRQGRFVLASGAAAGYALSLVRTPNELVVDSLTAILGGFMLFTVFNEELPRLSEARLLQFLGGIGTFIVLHFVIGTGAPLAEGV